MRHRLGQTVVLQTDCFVGRLRSSQCSVPVRARSNGSTAALGTVPTIRPFGRTWPVIFAKNSRMAGASGESGMVIIPATLASGSCRSISRASATRLRPCSLSRCSLSNAWKKVSGRVHGRLPSRKERKRRGSWGKGKKESQALRPLLDDPGAECARGATKDLPLGDPVAVGQRTSAARSGNRSG